MHKSLWIATLCGALVACAGSVRAQDAEVPATPAAEGAPDLKAENPLATKQQRVAERYRELERLLLRMAELTAPTDPRRAALLRQAVSQSKDRAIEQQFDELVRLLRDQRLAAVVKSQGQVQDDLAKLLELLLSEDRTKQIESEKDRIREYLKRVNSIIKEQKAVRGETERQGDPKKLAGQQSELADKTGKLAKDVDKSANQKPAGENKDDKPGEDGKPQDGGKESEKNADKDAKKDGKKESQQDKEKEGDKEKERDKDPKQPDESKDGKKEDKPDKPEQKSEKDKDAKSKDGKPGDPSEPKGGKPGEPPPVEPPDSQQGQEGQEGQQGQQGEQSQQQEQQQNPAQKRLEQAQKRMQEAQKKLEEAKRADATKQQEEALKELERAKAELEEILRQLREEEMSRTLAMLEARFRKMLDAQIEVYEGTQRLDKVAEAERDRDDEIEAGRLSRKEAGIATEAEKALDVLREEGSAVAFAEAVTGIRDDMYLVRDSLAKAQVGTITQDVEKDVITALEEMIAALQKAQKDLENKNQQQQPPQEGGGEGEMPLVDVLSELKMIRALQMRVNTRTKRYGSMIEAEQADKPELLKALRDLAAREQRIHKVTRDIVVGRNR